MEGREGLLSIHSEGDIFGEMCLTGLGPRIDTGTAMEATTLKQVSCSQFLECLRHNSLIEGFVRYLAARIADQQHVIANLVTVDSEKRLAQTLLRLAHNIGKKDVNSIRIEPKDIAGRTIPNGGHDTAADQFIYAALSKSWLDRD